MATFRTVIAGLVLISLTASIDAAVLRGPLANGSRFDFRLDGESNAVYLIERSTNLLDWSVAGRSEVVTATRALSFSNDLVGAFFRARRTNEPLLRFALAAERGIDFGEQRLVTDSFDSGDALYNDGFGHYTNSPGKWKAGGGVACNDTLTNAGCLGNANIRGKIATGPYGTVCIGSAGMVGDIAWQSNSANQGKIQPGWSTDDLNIGFPKVTIPAVSWLPVLYQGYTNTGVRYEVYLRGSSNANSPVYFEVPGGRDLNGRVYVEGHVGLLVQYPSKISLSGADRIHIASGGSLKLYADCVTASLGGIGVQNDGAPTQFYYFGTHRNTNLIHAGNSSFSGVLYAPNAALTIGAGGGAQHDFSGAAVARSIKLNGNFSFHYDEHLLRAGPFR
jgi:hypothetical protein